MKPASVPVYIGTFTESNAYFPNSTGAGIVIGSLDMATGRLTQLSATGNILNPNYLALDDSATHLYAITCHIESTSCVHSYRIGSQGSLTPINSQPINARVGCHLLVLPHNRLAAVSYFDSSLSIYPLTDGRLSPCEFHHRYEGRSVHPQRQEDSHAHQAVLSPDRNLLYVPDLGADRIWRHSLNSLDKLPPSFTPVPAGYGPRHLVFHPLQPLAYLICELSAHLLLYRWQKDTGDLTQLSDQSTLPADWLEKPAAAAIRVHPTGRALYVSNRNHNSVAVFSLDPQGTPSLFKHVPSLGEGPRDCAVDPTGHWLLIANQNSNTIVIHELDPTTGLPASQPPQSFPLNSPASVLA